MDRQTMFKFLFVLIVGILIIGVSIYSFIGSKKNKEYDEMFESELIEDTDESIDDDLLEQLKKEMDDEKRSDDGAIVDVNENNDETFEGEHEDYETTLDEFDYEKKYIKQFGEKNVKKTLVVAEKLAMMYLKKDKSWESWQEYVTPTFLNELKKSIPKEKNKRAKKIESLEIFSTEQINKDEIIVGCIAYYDDKTELLNIIFSEEGDMFLANKIIVIWSR